MRGTVSSSQRSDSGTQNHEPDENPIPKSLEEAILIYDEKDIEGGLEGCATSLIGRIITNKQINKRPLEQALKGIWNQPSGFRIEELEPKTFQFFFDNEQVMLNILNRGPWLFRSSWLILCRWSRNWKEEINF